MGAVWLFFTCENPLEIKRYICVALCCEAFSVFAQEAPQLDSIQRARATAGPKMFEFQPEHHVLNTLRRILSVLANIWQGF